MQEHEGTDGGQPLLSIDPVGTIKTLTEFIADRTRQAGKRRLVVGLSGGLDSAVAASLAVRALGREGLFCLLMPYRDSNPDSLRDARKMAEVLAVQSETLDISGFVDAFADLSGQADRIRLGNVMARARMILLFDRSALHDALVLGTSNKSELLLGYGTLHGDLACALNPLGDLYKTQVRALAEELGVPHSIRRKPPSADLWPSQSDEEELGFEYEKLDRLLTLLVDAGAGPQEVIDLGFPEEMVNRVTDLIARFQFKRRLPTIARLSSRRDVWLS
jgi:NAD+ synthase